MPGQTNNPNLLAAENQEIVALNEIVTAIEEKVIPPTQVEVVLDTTNLETAIANLQTTLVSTLDALKLVVKNLNFCCATTPPDTPEPGEPGGGSPGDPPGDTQTDPPGTPEQVASRRCKVARFLIDYYLDGVAEWCDKNDIDSWLNLAAEYGLTWATPFIAAFSVSITVFVLGLLAIPDPSDLVVGLISLGLTYYIVHAIAGEPVDFANMRQFIANNREAMICSLYNSQNALSAHNSLQATIDDISPSLSSGNRAFVLSLLGTASLALLFYVDENFQALEDWVAEQTDPCPCADDTPETGEPTDLYKCKAANYLFDSFVDSLSGWGTVANMTWYTAPTFIAAIAGGLLETLLGELYNLATMGSSAWPQFLAKLISKLGTLYWVGQDYFTAFTEVSNQFEAQKAVIICELYLAADVETARTELENRINDYVGTTMTTHPEWADQLENYQSVIKDLLPNSALNVLFEETERPEIANYAPEDYQECVLCGGGGCQEQLFTFDAGMEGFLAYQCHSGEHSTVAVNAGAVEVTGDVDGQLGHYAGIRKVYSPGMLIVEGDFASIEVTRVAGTENIFLQFDFADETTDYAQGNIQSHNINEPWVMSRDLTGQAGKTLIALRIYLDVYNDMSARLDNFTEKLCG